MISKTVHNPNTRNDIACFHNLIGKDDMCVDNDKLHFWLGHWSIDKLTFLMALRFQFNTIIDVEMWYFSVFSYRNASIIDGNVHIAICKMKRICIYVSVHN